MRPFLSVWVLAVFAAVPFLAQPAPSRSAEQAHASPARRAPDSFDRPLESKVLDFGPSPYSEGVRIKLSCYFFPTLMVKQLDAGEKGAEWLAIVPGKHGAAACTQSHAPGEKVIEGAEWSGYFKGASGDLVFFDADDGMNGGLPFAIFDSTTGKKIFEDTAYDATMWNERAAGSPFDRLRVIGAQDGHPVLRYLRVVEAGCDLRREKARCWKQVGKRLGLKGAPMPVCRHYRNITTRWESAVAYPVEVSLSPEPAARTIAGPVKCWPAD